MILDRLLAAYERIQDRRRRGLSPPPPYDVRLPLDRVQRVYAQHAWTSEDPVKNLEANERIAVLTMPPTWNERLRITKLRHHPHAQRQAMIEIMCERRLQYDLAQAVAHTIPSTQLVLPAKVTNLGPYHQQRLKHQQHVHATMLSTRKHESERTLQASPEAQAQQQRFREMAWKLEFLQQQVNAAKQQQRGLKPQPSHEADDTDNEPQPKV